jgi:hypothetical protein
MEHIVVGRNNLDMFITDFLEDINNGKDPNYIQHLICFGDKKSPIQLGLDFIYNTTDPLCNKDMFRCRLFMCNGYSEHDIHNTVYNINDDILHEILWDIMSPASMLKQGIDLELKPYNGGDLND